MSDATRYQARAVRLTEPPRHGGHGDGDDPAAARPSVIETVTRAVAGRR
ncbi:hypothetical protein ACIRL2_45875 [Embleya sp. NPDC127516]